MGELSLAPYKRKFSEADVKSEIKKLNKAGIRDPKWALSEFKELVGDSFIREKGHQIDIEDIAGDLTTYSGVYNGTKLYELYSDELGEFLVDVIPMGWSSEKVQFVDLKTPNAIAYWYPSEDKIKGAAKDYITKIEKKLPWTDVEYHPDYNTIIIRYQIDNGKKVHGYLHLDKEEDGFKFGYRTEKEMIEDSKPSLEEAYDNLVKAIGDL